MKVISPGFVFTTPPYLAQQQHADYCVTPRLHEPLIPCQQGFKSMTELSVLRVIKRDGNLGGSSKLDR